MVAVQDIYLVLSLFVVNPPESVEAPLSLSPSKGLASFLLAELWYELFIPFSR